ncbi:glycosyltransferase family 2 protein [Neptuniibacter sp. 2_MG-2023]|uniref:glycosyltransferase family 2 protein n=1 Tax=Neptuniibacter sp. 2_MG-2023 TaxID=3062671 RepID=UPI0026E3B863|nr:glycosyltransferase family 2 protein [Neptuniibacter sp. 2_MG-2023]MDO6514984.1 glycosyltransferase family 2 protein [Neptuniibacter sp. 2_MG-2023]
MISIIIITKNEAHNIQDCLGSVSWADEIIVVDSGSEDGTQDICHKTVNCTLVETDWPGFGEQKNRALALASHEWVLSIDADERIDNALKDEILNAIEQSQYDGFEIPRHSQYCGRFIDHSGWTPDYVLRLFKREKAVFSDDKVHERVILNGKTHKLSNPMQHYSYENLEQVLRKVDQYSTLGAEQLYARGKRCGLGTALYKSFWAFIRTYLLRRGFLDGKHGVMLAISNAEATYYKYAKLALMSSSDK